MVILIAVGGAIVRFMLAYNRPFFGDECGTMRYICYSWRYILGHFDLWLTMNFFILLEKFIAQVFGEGFIAMRIISLAAGTGTILLGALVAAKLFNKQSVALLTAVLLAANPYLIDFSAKARAYETFALFALFLWVAFLRWRAAPNWINSIIVAGVCLLLIMNHLNGAFLFPWLIVVIGLEAFRVRHDTHQYNHLKRGIKRLCIPMTVCVVGAGTYYFFLLQQIMRHNEPYQRIGYSFLKNIPDLFGAYCGGETGFIAGFCAVLFLAGIFSIMQTSRYTFLWMVLWIIIPLGSIAILGYSFSTVHSGRFMIFTVPVVLMLIALGFETVTAWFGRRVQQMLMPVMIIGIVLAWRPVITEQFAECRRFPMHTVYKYIVENQSPGDRIVGIEYSTLLYITPYMPCAERKVASESNDIFRVVLSVVPELMKHTEAGKIFVVAPWSDIPTFGAQTTRFGDVRVSVLPPEPSAERYKRLLNGYEKAAQEPQQGKQTAQRFKIYLALADLATLRGDAKMAGYFNGIAQKDKGASALYSFLFKNSRFADNEREGL